MVETSAPAAPPRVIPWRVIAIVMTVAFGVIGAALLMSPTAGFAAVAGVISSLFGTFLSPRHKATIPLLATAAAFLILLTEPSWSVLWITGFLLVAVVGW
ncbi:MAG: hypothetical protein GDA40_05790 [Rhodobacteraceae bacterium]|nr:hypothetical protein [Paracoccaceae bacterium]